MYQTITLYTLNLHNVVCQLYLNKAGGGERKKRIWLGRDKVIQQWISGKEKRLYIQNQDRTSRGHHREAGMDMLSPIGTKAKLELPRRTGLGDATCHHKVSTVFNKLALSESFQKPGQNPQWIFSFLIVFKYISSFSLFCHYLGLGSYQSNPYSMQVSVIFLQGESHCVTSLKFNGLQ